ncbi:hypothetical protein YC2023_059371 [Brassica napus]
MLTCRRTLTKSMRKKGPTMILILKTTKDSIWNHQGFCITDDFKVNKASHAQKFLNASRLNEA